MSCYRAAVFLWIIVFFCLTILSPVLAGQRTLSGTINDQDQFESIKGDIYEIADTEAGIELLSEPVGSTVMVTGDVVEDEEITFIMVESYTLGSSSTSPPAGTEDAQRVQTE
jgi:hypothetical protein